MLTSKTRGDYLREHQDPLPPCTYEVEHETIFNVFDVSHLFKEIRNNFMKKDIKGNILIVNA